MRASEARIYPLLECGLNARRMRVECEGFPELAEGFPKASRGLPQAAFSRSAPPRALRNARLKPKWLRRPLKLLLGTRSAADLK